MQNSILECRHFEKCSGCSVQEIHNPSIYRDAKEFFERYGFTLDLCIGNIYNWRIRSKLAVRKNSNQIHIGLFALHSHNVVDIPLCRVHHSRINEAVQLFKELCMKSSLSIYDESKHLGIIRYVQFIVERISQKVQCTVVCNATNFESIQSTVQTISNKIQEKASFWHSLWFNLQPKKTNTIFGDVWKKVYGEEFIEEKLLEKKYLFLPSHFGQANLEAFESLLNEFRKFIPKNSRLVEYFAGSGILSLSVAENIQYAHLVESNPFSKKSFEGSKKLLSDIIQQKITYHVYQSDDALKLLKDADVCIVDPPRKGLSETFIKEVSDVQSVHTLIYISCFWFKAKEDIEKLLAIGWTLYYAKSFLFFPGTDAIETLIVLKKKSG